MYENRSANHSCSPNTAFEISASIPEADWAFVALAEIKAGEEFTFFYPSTEWEMDQPFECQCGSKVSHPGFAGSLITVSEAGV